MLGTEHRGRVKGEGKYVTPSTFFNIADPHLEWEKERGMLRKEIVEMKQQLKPFAENVKLLRACLATVSTMKLTLA